MIRPKKPAKKIKLKGQAAIDAVKKMQAENSAWRREQMRKRKAMK